MPQTQNIQRHLVEKDQLQQSARLGSNLNKCVNSPKKRMCTCEGRLIFPRNSEKLSPELQLLALINEKLWKVQGPMSKVISAVTWMHQSPSSLPAMMETLIYPNSLVGLCLLQKHQHSVEFNFPCRSETRERLYWPWAHKYPSNWTCSICYSLSFKY